MDLRDLWRDQSVVTPRYVLWIVGQLGPDSAFHASCRGGSEFRAWTPTSYLLAGIANLLNAANRQRAGKKTRAPLVKPPSNAPRARVVSVAEVAARQQREAQQVANSN